MSLKVIPNLNVVQCCRQLSVVGFGRCCLLKCAFMDWFKWFGLLVCKVGRTEAAKKKYEGAIRESLKLRLPSYLSQQAKDWKFLSELSLVRISFAFRYSRCQLPLSASIHFGFVSFAFFLISRDFRATAYHASHSSWMCSFQGKTVQQAEIDAAAELADFLRFSVQFAFVRQFYLVCRSQLEPHFSLVGSHQIPADKHKIRQKHHGLPWTGSKWLVSTKIGLFSKNFEKRLSTMNSPYLVLVVELELDLLNVAG